MLTQVVVKECDCNYVTEGKFRTWLLQCKIPGFVPVRVSDTYRIRYPHRYPCNIARDGRGGGKASLPTGVMVAAHGWAPPPRQHAFSAFLYLSLKVGGQWQTAMTTATSRRRVLLPVVAWPVLPPPSRALVVAPPLLLHLPTIARLLLPRADGSILGGWIDSWRQSFGAAQDRPSPLVGRTTVLSLAVRHGSTSHHRPFARRQRARRLVEVKVFLQKCRLADDL
jgi:hypothetical protein